MGGVERYVNCFLGLRPFIPCQDIRERYLIQVPFSSKWCLLFPPVDANGHRKKSGWLAWSITFLTKARLTLSCRGPHQRILEDTCTCARYLGITWIQFGMEKFHPEQGPPHTATQCHGPPTIPLAGSRHPWACALMTGSLYLTTAQCFKLCKCEARDGDDRLHSKRAHMGPPLLDLHSSWFQLFLVFFLVFTSCFLGRPKVPLQSCITF
jgi:hypothetical protein